MSAAVDVLAVFSGDCLQAICGISTGFKDMRGSELRTGDIVCVFTVREYGQDGERWAEMPPDGLTAVVSDEWTTYTDGSFRRKDGAPEFFVMGIKSVPLDEPGVWRVMKVKDYEDVVAGEHWRAYGFNYRPVPDAVRAGGAP